MRRGSGDKQIPKERERYVKKFAWWPRKVSGMSVWMEHYIERQYFYVDGRHPTKPGVMRQDGLTGWGERLGAEEWLLPENMPATQKKEGISDG